ncbi:sensor histidine kinase [Saccharomonospora glauca]|uniref:sensor histidine kinase n=1 Tax=Saccharomonospora glauca TaxID=40990 RepID=UPI00024A285D|nr:ATP-binding protein [Saccharomonospora glauca]
MTNVVLPERPSPLIESTVYFTVSEALSNAVKHSGADRVDITGSRVGDTLVVTVKDNGHGGADPARGTGLQGMVDRVAATGGKLLLASPAGGPTELRMEIPWTATASR